MFHSLKITHLHHETSAALTVGLEVPEKLREKFQFKPGQFVMVQVTLLGEEITRSYSLTSQPQDDMLTITIKKIADGCVSGHLHDTLKLGEHLQVSVPRGLFCNHTENATHRHVYFAAGSGITPIFSMLNEVLAQDAESRVTLFYGNKKAGDTIFFEPLNNLKDIYLSRFELVHIFSEQKRDLPLLNGRMDAERVGDFFKSGMLEADAQAHYYICGPDSMVGDIKQALGAQGVDEKCIFSEEFIAQKRPASLPDAKPAKASRPQMAEGIKVSITLHGTQEMVYLNGEADNLLDAALAQGIKLPFSCRAGMCSTCRCKLKTGKLDMKHNYSLEPWELEQGFILGCQVTLEAIKADQKSGKAALELDFDAS